MFGASPATQKLTVSIDFFLFLKYYIFQNTADNCIHHKKTFHKEFQVKVWSETHKMPIRDFMLRGKESNVQVLSRCRNHSLPTEQSSLKMSNVLPFSVLYQHIFSEGGYTWYSHLLYGPPVEEKKYRVITLC